MTHAEKPSLREKLRRSKRVVAATLAGVALTGAVIGPESNDSANVDVIEEIYPHLDVSEIVHCDLVSVEVGPVVETPPGVRTDAKRVPTLNVVINQTNGERWAEFLNLRNLTNKHNEVSANVWITASNELADGRKLGGNIGLMGAILLDSEEGPFAGSIIINPKYQGDRTVTLHTEADIQRDFIPEEDDKERSPKEISGSTAEPSGHEYSSKSSQTPCGSVRINVNGEETLTILK
jgi:hypothetical protein